MKVARFTMILAGVFMLVCAIPKAASAADTAVAAKGEYAKIDEHRELAALDIFAHGTAAQKDDEIAQIEAAPDRYAPFVFYAMSEVLFQNGNKDDAAFWFYAGQLRARFDANRCADVSARSAVSVLNQRYGTPINQYAFGNPAMLEKLIPRVVDWDRKTPHNYDPRWINLHGMNAMIAGLGNTPAATEPLSLPSNQWDAIAEKTRSDYLNGFHAALKQLGDRH